MREDGGPRQPCFRNTVRSTCLARHFPVLVCECIRQYMAHCLGVILIGWVGYINPLRSMTRFLFLFLFLFHHLPHAYIRACKMDPLHRTRDGVGAGSGCAIGAVGRGELERDGIVGMWWKYWGSGDWRPGGKGPEKWLRKRMVDQWIRMDGGMEKVR
ncbi:hypothetical protein BDR22DRAFT_591666 [Usnea florida]